MKIDEILKEIGYSFGSENFEALNDIFIKKYKEYVLQKDNDDKKTKNLIVNLQNYTKNFIRQKNCQKNLQPRKLKDYLPKKSYLKKRKTTEKKKLKKQLKKQQKKKQLKKQQKRKKPKNLILKVKQKKSIQKKILKK